MVKGPSIKDVSPEGEGGGYPKRRRKEMGGRDPVLSKGDVFFETLMNGVKSNKYLSFTYTKLGKTEFKFEQKPGE